MLLSLATAGAMYAQITDPIPAHVEKRGLMVEIRDVVRLPETRGMRPAEQDVNPPGWARVSCVRDLPDGRRFVNDSRGFLYVLDRNKKTPTTEFPKPWRPSRRFSCTCGARMAPART